MPRRLASVSIAATLFMASCSSPGPSEREDREPLRPRISPQSSEPVSQAKPRPVPPAYKPAGFVVPAEIASARSVEGRELRHRLRGRGPERLFLVASIHGNEAAGTPLFRGLDLWLDENPEALEGKTLLIVDVANPDGIAQSKRFNQHGVDLNRNFPSKNFRGRERHGEEALSEPESRFLHDLFLAFRPTRVVSMHQPVNVIDYDGPAQKLAEAMGQAIGMKVKRIGSRPGSMGSFVGVDHQTPIITFELPRSADRLEQAALWERYGAALVAFVRGAES